MENLLNGIATATQNIVNPISQGVNNIVQSLNNNFQQHVAQPVENGVANIYNALNANLQRQLPNAITIPFPEQQPDLQHFLQNETQHPVANLLAQTPSLISSFITHPLQSAVPGGDNILSNAARDAIGIGGGLLSLPGEAVNVLENPSQIVPIGESIANNYKQDFGYNPQTDTWSFQNAGSNFLHRPLSTILDLLPVAGIASKLTKLGEAGDVAEAGNVAESATPLEESPTAGPTGAEKANNLLSYPAKMREMGFSQKQIDQTSAPQAYDMFQKGITPSQFDEYRGQSTTSAANAANESKPTQLSLIKSLPDSIKQTFADWVNNRAAAPIEGMAKGQDFSKYDSLGQQGFQDFQADPTQFADLKNYFDQRYQQLKDAGVDVNYKDNYLPQLFKLDDNGANIVKNINPTNAPFTFQSVLDNYEEGLQAGLTPKYDNLGDLAQWYEQRSGKLLADKQFVTDLTNQGFLKDATSAPKDWSAINPDNFPGSDGTYWKAPKPLADAINNYMTADDSTLAKIGKVQSAIKNTVLSSGIPKTGLNWHGLSTLTRQVLSSDNPVSGFWTGAKYLIRPSLAQDAIDSDLAGAATAVKHGLNLSIEDHNFFSDMEPKGLAGDLAAKWRSIFEDPLFKQSIPALKLNRFNTIAENLVKSGYSVDEAGRIAAEQTNNIFGGQNLAQIARSNTMQTLLKNITFAPDYTESTIKTGAGIVKSLLNPLNPETAVYRTMARNLVMAYISENLTQKALSGSYSFQNPAGHTFDIKDGTTPDGQTRYITPFASGIDFLKVPYDFASSLVSGNTAKAASTFQNRLAPVPGEAIRQMTNVNYLGQPLYPKNAPLGEQLAGRGAELLASVVPPQIGALARYATGNLGPEQAITSGIQAPVRYGGGATTKAEKQQVAILQAGGATGDQISQQVTGEKAQAQAKLQAKAAMAAKSQPNGVFDGMFKWLGMGTQQDPSQINSRSTSTGDPLMDALNKQKNLTDQAAYIKQVYTSGLDPAGIDKALTSKGIDPSEAKFIMMKSLDVENRVPVIQSILQQVSSSPDLFSNAFTVLVQHGILTTGETTQMLKDGTINDTQKKSLDKLIDITNNASVRGITYMGTGSGSGYATSLRSRIPARFTSPFYSVPTPTITPYNVNPTVTPLPKLLPFKKPSAILPNSSQATTYNNPFNAPPPNPNVKPEYGSMPSVRTIA